MLNVPRGVGGVCTESVFWNILPTNGNSLAKFLNLSPKFNLSPTFFLKNPPIPPASAALGQDLLTDINNLRFANGGAVGGGSGGSLASTTTNNNSTMGDVNISVNVDGNGNASVDATTNGEQTPKQAREFAEKVKAVVLQTIQEEQRIAGSLFGT